MDIAGGGWGGGPGAGCGEKPAGQLCALQETGGGPRPGAVRPLCYSPSLAVIPEIVTIVLTLCDVCMFILVTDTQQSGSGWTWTRCAPGARPPSTGTPT